MTQDGLDHHLAKLNGAASVASAESSRSALRGHPAQGRRRQDGVQEEPGQGIAGALVLVAETQDGSPLASDRTAAKTCGTWKAATSQPDSDEAPGVPGRRKANGMAK